jgi:hypothetical protein
MILKKKNSNKNINLKKKKYKKSSYPVLKNYLTDFSRLSKNKPFVFSNDNKWSRSLNIKITSNNVFYTLVDIENKQKTLKHLSAGTCGLSCSKKLLKFTSKTVLDKFLFEIKDDIRDQVILFRFSGPLRLRRFILYQIFFALKKK